MPRRTRPPAPSASPSARRHRPTAAAAPRRPLPRPSSTRLAPPALLPLLIALAASLGGCAEERSAPEARVAPGGVRTVVLISIDTLRPDRLGVYGNTSDVSPAIDALGAQAVVFDDALAPAPWTLPSHMSMLTGLDPVAHGVKRESVVLSKHVTTLAEILQAAGFRTAAFTDGGFMRGAWGLADGFEHFDDVRSESGPNGMRRILPKVTDWIAGHAEEDYFLLVHTFDAHSPFDDGTPEVLERFCGRPVEPSERDHRLFPMRFFHQQEKMGVDEFGRINALLNAYDAGVHDADRGVAGIVEALKATGRWDDALVIVTSDHGESMLEHGLHVGHGIGLTDDEIAIPLLVRLPGGRGAGTRIDTTIDLLDLAPTILDVFGLEPDPHMQGESLLRLVEGKPRRRDYIIGHSSNIETYYLVRNGYKYITPLGVPVMKIAQAHLGATSPPDPTREGIGETYTLYPGTTHPVELSYDVLGDPLAMRDVLRHGERLYHRASDPGEEHDLSAEKPEILANMRSFFREVRERSNDVYVELFDTEGEVPPKDVHAEHQLAQLGYLDGGGKVDYLEMSKAMREELKNPHRPPDMTEVYAADRDVHELRLAIDAGRAPPDVKQRLEQAGYRYIAWITEQGDDGLTWQPRIGWRIWELVALGERAGAAIDQEALMERGLQLWKEKKD